MYDQNLSKVQLITSCQDCLYLVRPIWPWEKSQKPVTQLNPKKTVWLKFKKTGFLNPGCEVEYHMDTTNSNDWYINCYDEVASCNKVLYYFYK